MHIAKKKQEPRGVFCFSKPLRWKQLQRFPSVSVSLGLRGCRGRAEWKKQKWWRVVTSFCRSLVKKMDFAGSCSAPRDRHSCFPSQRAPQHDHPAKLQRQGEIFIDFLCCLFFMIFSFSLKRTLWSADVAPPSLAQRKIHSLAQCTTTHSPAQRCHSLAQRG